VWAKKASVSEPLLTCRKGQMRSKPGLLGWSGMSGASDRLVVNFIAVVGS